MQIIAFLLFIVIVVLLITALMKDKSDKKTKWISVGSLIILILLIFGYERYVTNVEDANRALLQSFNQGKSLTCNGTKVDSTRFNYEHGTGSFMAKKEFKNLAGVIIPITQCSK